MIMKEKILSQSTQLLPQLNNTEIKMGLKWKMGVTHQLNHSVIVIIANSNEISNSNDTNSSDDCSKQNEDSNSNNGNYSNDKSNNDY